MTLISSFRELLMTYFFVYINLYSLKSYLKKINKIYLKYKFEF